MFEIGDSYIKEIEGEIWKKVIGYEEQYEISNKGRIKSLNRKVKHPIADLNLKGKLLTPTVSGNGYYHTILSYKNNKKTVNIHRLVAIHFLEKIEGCDIVNHKDFNRLNNKVENLEWCTQKQNVQHSVANNRQIYKKGKDNHNFGSKVLKGKITDNQSFLINYLVKNIDMFISTKEIYNHFNDKKPNFFKKSSVVNQVFKGLEKLNFIEKNNKSEYCIKIDSFNIISKLYGIY